MTDFTFVVSGETTAPTVGADFAFVVSGETTAPTAGADPVAINVFNRTSNGAINLEGRGAVTDGSVGSFYSLGVLISSLQIEVGQACTVAIRARANSEVIVDKIITIISSNPGFGVVPVQMLTSSIGLVTFSILNLAAGSTNISATMEVDGTTIASNVVTITAITLEQSENYASTGLGRVSFSVEPAMVEALNPKLERMSHREQQLTYPGDMGLQWATYFESREIVFLPKALQR